MRTRLTSLVLCVVLASPALARGAAIGVGFKPGVYRGPASVTAADVLVFSVDGGTVPAELPGLPLQLPAGLAPLTQDWVLAQLQGKADGATFTWFGAKTLQRAAPLQRPEPRDVVATAQAVLEAALQGGGGEVSITPVGEVRPPLLEPGAVTMKAHLQGTESLRSRMAVAVDVYRDGQLGDTVTAWFAVKVIERMPVYARDLRAEQEVTDADIRWEMQDAAALPSAPVPDAAALGGKWLKRPVQSGGPVLLDDLTVEPAVRHDQRVEVRLVNGPVQIVAWGVARQSGETGDMVDVTVDKAEGPCKGRVIGRGVVQVGD